MIPITRKERYINQIVGGGDTAPVTPITEEEFFFSDILGEVNAPFPITNIEKYLAKIANRYSGELPEPITRIERFIARAAGMDIETPTPITNEEIFWSNYSAIIDFEVEGIPPLTYKAVAGVLNDYRIYGNTAGGESVGDLETTGEHAGEYKVPVTVSNGTDTLTTPIYLPEQIKMVGNEAEYVDYAEQKWHRVRKNLLPNTATSMTINGITYTVNEDGSITCNGTAKNSTEFTVKLDFLLSAGNYRLTGCPSGGGFSSYYLRAWYSSSGVLKWLYDFGSSRDFTLTNTTAMRCSIVIEKAQVVDNITFYPMIRKADIEDDTYEPYITNTELDVTLPALPVLPGTNTLTVGTEVQPSDVYIKYKGRKYE